MTWIAGLTSVLCQLFVRTAAHESGQFTVVGLYSLCGLTLYTLTRGREFLWAGYASVLFLIPFL